jgi:hypothetical protein
MVLVCQKGKHFMASYGPANGNFKHGFNSMYCNADRQLGTALQTRTEMFVAIENVLTNRTEGMSEQAIRQAKRVIDDRPSWAEFLIARFDKC